MSNWKKHFTNQNIKDADNFIASGAVSKMQKRKGTYTTQVLDNGTIYRPFISVDDENNIRGWGCTCNAARFRRPCTHVAALCLMYDKKFPSIEDTPELEAKIKLLKDKLLPAYEPAADAFMNFNAIESELFKDSTSIYEALLVLERKEIVPGPIRQYFDQYGNQHLKLTGTIPSQNDEQVYLDLLRDSTGDANCFSRKCYGKNLCYWRENTEFCKHVRALYLVMQHQFKAYNYLDATNLGAKRLMNRFTSDALRESNSQEELAHSRLSLVPRVKYNGEQLELSFRTGSSKLFVIKNINSFIDNVHSNAVMKFGKSTELAVGRHNFGEDSLKYLDFIENCINEIKEYNSRIPVTRYGYSYEGITITDSILLTGKWLDDFFDLTHHQIIDYTGPDGKRGQTITTSCKDPELSMELMPIPAEYNHAAGNMHFYGISGYMEIPTILKGREYFYYIKNNTLCRISEKLTSRIAMLLPATGISGTGGIIDNDDEHLLSISVGRNELSEFYSIVLPQLEEFIDINSVNLDFISEYLPDELELIFYLDAADGNILCKGEAKYGEKVYSLLDCERARRDPMWKTDSLRIITKEQEALACINSYLGCIDLENDLLHCEGDESSVFRFLESGIDLLMSMGQVNATDAFKNLNIHKKLNLSVGVSVSHGLLDLTISSDNISREDILEILDSYKLKKKYHRLKNGSFVNTEDDSIKMLSEFLDSAQISDKEFLKDNIHIPAYRALYLDKLLEENDNIYEERDSHFKQLIKDFKTISDSDFEVPVTLSRVMRNYQKTGFKWLCTLEQYHFGGILCDDMGLGKTLQVISVLLAACKKNINTSLIVCPASLVYNWENEFITFAPGMKIGVVSGTKKERQKILSEIDSYDALITSYDLLRIDIADYENYNFHYQIADEAQFIKNPKTGAAKAVKAVKSSIRYALTGTPIENRLSELWSIFDYIMPGYLYRYETFRKTFEIPVVKYNDQNSLQRLKKMVAPFILRRLKTEVLKDLPDKIENDYVVALADEQRQLYDARALKLRTELAASNDAEFSKNKIKVLAELTRLRQICCDPSLCYENFTDESSKRHACIDLVQNGIANGHRILIFSQFTSMLELIEKDLSNNGIEFFKITGSTPKDLRLSLVKKFNTGSTPVFLVSLKAGGTGLNLTGADMVIHYDPWWNLAVQNQATDRTHRIGQKNTVVVYRLIAKNTIEEKITKIQDTKRDLADQILSGEVNILSRMSKEDFLQLL